MQFKNGGCNQSLLITGRTPLYLTALWTDQHSSKPSELVKAITALAGLAAPLAGFVAPGVAGALKLDTGAAQSMAQPYSQLLGSIDSSSSETITTSALKQGYYQVTSPGGGVSISIDRISSIQSAFKVREIRNAFDSSLQALGAQVQKDPTTCIAIGRGLELYQNLSHADAVYALARIVVASAIPEDKAATCLGSVYGPEVAADSYWKKK
jgi:hypothetical protein